MREERLRHYENGRNTSWVEDEYEKRQEDEEKKSSHGRQKVHNVCVVLVEEQFSHLELNICLLLIGNFKFNKT